jgi:hypothetical protein
LSDNESLYFLCKPIPFWARAQSEVQIQRRCHYHYCGPACRVLRRYQRWHRDWFFMLINSRCWISFDRLTFRLRFARQAGGKFPKQWKQHPIKLKPPRNARAQEQLARILTLSWASCLTTMSSFRPFYSSWRVERNATVKQIWTQEPWKKIRSCDRSYCNMG